MPVDPTLLFQTVQDLRDRFGANALAMAQERVERASRAGDQSALDLALMVLTEVERHHSVGNR